MSILWSHAWTPLGLLLLQCFYVAAKLENCDGYEEHILTLKLIEDEYCQVSDISQLEGRLSWHDEGDPALHSCLLSVLSIPQTSGAYQLMIALPDKPNARLSICSDLGCQEVTQEIVDADRMAWCPDAIDQEKRGWAGHDMQWLKRSGWQHNKKFDVDTINWLEKRMNSFPWSKQKKPTWNEAGVNWLKKRAWSKANTNWLKRGWASNVDMNWLKRGWSYGDADWLKKRSDPSYDRMSMAPKRWNSDEISWLKKRDTSAEEENWYDNNDRQKRAWANANTDWIKRDTDMQTLHHISKRDTSAQDAIVKRSSSDDMEHSDLDINKKNWGASGMSWIKRDPEMDKKNWGSSGMSWIKREGLDADKKNWGASGMSWIKRGEDDKEKRNWGSSGMSWIKRNQEDEKRNWGASGMSWIKRDSDNNDKRNWGSSGMSWIKRGKPEAVDKKNWGASGMSWIKRDPDEKRNWGASGMSWIKRDSPEKEKKNWGASGMSWIKRDQIDGKRNWGGSGMSWIKRESPEGDDDLEADKKNWGASGMSWIKRDQNDKRNWGSSGMSWIKRQDPKPDKKNWGSSGMSWIKRDDIEADKKNWGSSGMSWIKRGDIEANKKNWGSSGMSWIKRDDIEADKKNWGSSGMSWIKRSGENSIPGKSDLNSINTRQWTRDIDWLKRDSTNDQKMGNAKLTTYHPEKSKSENSEKSLANPNSLPASH